MHGRFLRCLLLGCLLCFFLFLGFAWFFLGGKWCSWFCRKGLFLGDYILGICFLGFCKATLSVC